MATETLSLPDPASPNVNDGAQVYDLAVGFATSAAGSAIGVEWFVPTTPGATAVAKWWRVSDGALLASKTFTPAAGTRQSVSFDSPVSVPAGSYRVSVETIFFTLTTAWGGWPASSAHMVTANPDGWLSVGPGFPNDGPRTALYHVSPIWEADSVAPVEGAAAQTATLAGTSAAAVTRSTTAAQTVTFTGAAVAVGVRSVDAAQTVSLAGTAAAAGVRPTTAAQTATFAGTAAASVVTPGLSADAAQTVTFAGTAAAMVVHNAQAQQTIGLDGTAVPEPNPEPVIEQTGSWEGILVAVNEARAEHAAAEERRRHPIDCPTHLWPLEVRNGTYHCKFGGHVVRTPTR